VCGECTYKSRHSLSRNICVITLKAWPLQPQGNPFRLVPIERKASIAGIKFWFAGRAAYSLHPLRYSGSTLLHNSAIIFSKRRSFSSCNTGLGFRICYFIFPKRSMHLIFHIRLFQKRTYQHLKKHRLSIKVTHSLVLSETVCYFTPHYIKVELIVILLVLWIFYWRTLPGKLHSYEKLSPV
jgi:hypothetical protein